MLPELLELLGLVRLASEAVGHPSQPVQTLDEPVHLLPGHHDNLVSRHVGLRLAGLFS